MYSWSIRVVEKRQSALAIARRMTSTQRLRQAVRVALVVGRHDLLLEDPVQVLRIAPVLGGLVGVGLAPADRPAVVLLVALVPPAVEHADVEDAVLGGLHAGRPRRLERPARVVEPDVDALHEEARDAHVVVLEDEHAAAQLRRARALEDLLDHPLAGPVGRVRLAGEDDLDRAIGVGQHRRPAGRCR